MDLVCIEIRIGENRIGQAIMTIDFSELKEKELEEVIDKIRWGWRYITKEDKGKEH